MLGSVAGLSNCTAPGQRRDTPNSSFAQSTGKWGSMHLSETYLPQPGRCCYEPYRRIYASLYVVNVNAFQPESASPLISHVV
jgi:hypothetical protein